MTQTKSPYASVYEKIGYYRANSNDVSFHTYLDRKLEEAEKGLRIPGELEAELDANYARYLRVAMNTGTYPHPSPSVTPSPSNGEGYNGQGEGYNSVLPTPGTVANPDYVANFDKQETKRTKLEIKIGAGLLSVIGAVFVLVALVYFGMYFLDDIFQGIAIYAGGVVVILVSELVLARKFKLFSHIITGIGFSALYFATLFCFTELNLFNLYISLAIIGGIALINVFFARLKKSQIMEVVCSLASLAPLYVIKDKASFDVFIFVAAIIVVLNAITICIPTKERRSAPIIIGQAALTFGYFFMNFNSKFGSISELYFTVFACICVLLLLLSYAIHNQYPESEAFAVFFAACAAVSRINSGFEFTTENIVLIVSILIASLIPFLILIKKKAKWTMYYFFLFFELLMFYFAKEEMWTAVAFLVVLLLSKLVSNIKDTAWYDMLLTSIVLICTCFLDGNYLCYAIFGVAVLGLLMCTDFKLYYDFLLAFTGICFIVRGDYGYFTMPLWVTWLILLVLIANLVPTMRVKGNVAFNICCMVMVGLAIVLTPFFPDNMTEEFILFGFSAVAGIVCCLGFLREKFGMNTQFRYIIMAIILTYLAWLIDVDKLFISISLMSVAFISIAVGCIANRFELRLYGLVLSLLVCIKVAFYDFGDEDEFNRMIVFLVVGLLAIGISVAYLFLEKHEQKQLKQIKEAKLAAAQGTMMVSAPVVSAQPAPDVVSAPVINPLPETVIINNEVVEEVVIDNSSVEENSNCAKEQQ